MANNLTDQSENLTQEQTAELLESAWGIIANAYGGDWDLASPTSGWKEAAERWRDRYHVIPDGSSMKAETIEMET